MYLFVVLQNTFAAIEVENG